MIANYATRAGAIVSEQMGKSRGISINLSDCDPEWLVEAEKAQGQAGADGEAMDNKSLAELAGVHPSRITRMYHGECTDETADLVSKVLQIRRPMMVDLDDKLFAEWTLRGQRLRRDDPARFAQFLEQLRAYMATREEQMEHARHLFEPQQPVPKPTTPAKPAPPRTRSSKPRV